MLTLSELLLSLASCLSKVYCTHIGLDYLLALYGATVGQKAKTQQKLHNEQIQVIATIAEVFWEQTKLMTKQQSGTRSQLPQPFASQSIDDIILFVHNLTSDNGEDNVCLLIHNILAQVSCCPQVCVVASVDHVNATLIWDKKMVHNSSGAAIMSQHLHLTKLKSTC
ncbi:hypothetical protein GUJ93_ZPchr0006g40922 [Zizania palustris]|uniref:Origin recognition complex subunit 2 n=1 Tax=Zizania palustris TaxID=103762 RepID=A0A8J5W3Q6_ZIZPA|nr:hypothetical protein GUJ93_ZPchr0006g40922 [Zizania palustris]